MAAEYVPELTVADPIHGWNIGSGITWPDWMMTPTPVPRTPGGDLEDCVFELPADDEDRMIIEEDEDVQCMWEKVPPRTPRTPCHDAYEELLEEDYARLWMPARSDEAIVSSPRDDTVFVIDDD